MERANRAHDDLRGALVREVRRLAEGRTHEPLPQADGVALTRGKVEPMVRGLSVPVLESVSTRATYPSLGRPEGRLELTERGGASGRRRLGGQAVLGEQARDGLFVNGGCSAI
jgi:hypothetical protein